MILYIHVYKDEREEKFDARNIYVPLFIIFAIMRCAQEHMLKIKIGIIMPLLCYMKMKEDICAADERR